MTHQDLRRVGLYARQPARRRQQAMCLQDMPVEALEWLATQATGADAAATIEGWLQDGSWRDRWAREVARRKVHAVEHMDPDRLAGLVQARVLGDRRSVDEVAFEFGLSRLEVEQLVMRGGIAQGLDDQVITRALESRRVGARRSVRAKVTAAAEPKAEERPLRSRDEVARWFAEAGRRPPSHVVEVLCGREATGGRP